MVNWGMQCENDECYYKRKHREDDADLTIYEENDGEQYVLCDVCAESSDLGTTNAKVCRTCDIRCLYEVETTGGLCGTCFREYGKPDHATFATYFAEAFGKRKHDYEELCKESDDAFYRKKYGLSMLEDSNVETDYDVYAEISDFIYGSNHLDKFPELKRKWQELMNASVRQAIDRILNDAANAKKRKREDALEKAMLEAKKDGSAELTAYFRSIIQRADEQKVEELLASDSALGFLSKTRI